MLSSEMGYLEEHPRDKTRPLNHSIIKLHEGVCEGGHKFITDGLELALKIRPYDVLYRYGEIQQVFSYFDKKTVHPVGKGRTSLKVDSNITQTSSFL